MVPSNYPRSRSRSSWSKRLLLHHLWDDLALEQLYHLIDPPLVDGLCIVHPSAGSGWGREPSEPLLPLHVNLHRRVPTAIKYLPYEYIIDPRHI